MQIKSKIDISNEQLEKIKAAVKERVGTLDHVEYIEIDKDDEGVVVTYKVNDEPKIERIRRIN